LPKLLLMTRRGVAYLDDQLLTRTDKLVRILCRLALAAHDPFTRRDAVTLEQLAQIEGTFERANLKSFRAQLGRELKKLRELAPHLLGSPDEPRFPLWLNLEQVQEIHFDRDPLELWSWLGLRPPQAEPHPAQGRLALLASQAHALLEAGRLELAQSCIDALLSGVSNPEATLEGLLAQTELHFQEGKLEDAWDSFKRARDLLPLVNAAHLHLRLELYRARLLCWQGHYPEAEAVATALSSAPAYRLDPHLRGRLALVRGLIALEWVRGDHEPRQALPFFQSALEEFRGQHSWWGVQAALHNLGLCAYHQAHSLPRASAGKLEWLERARGFLQHSLNFAQDTGYGYVRPQHLLYLVKVLRLLGDLEGARLMLERVKAALEEVSDSRSDAEYLLEVGELAWAQGLYGEARGVWSGLARLELSQEAHEEIEVALEGRLEGVSA